LRAEVQETAARKSPLPAGYNWGMEPNPYEAPISDNAPEQSDRWLDATYWFCVVSVAIFAVALILCSLVIWVASNW